MRLSVSRMAVGLVTLVDEVNLKGDSLLVRKVFGLGGTGLMKMRMKQRRSVCLSLLALSASLDKSDAVLIWGCHKFKIK